MNQEKQFHKDNTLQVAKIYNQIKELRKISANNCKVIAKLMPLVDLIPVLKEIAEEKRAITLIGRNVLKILGVISLIIGIIIGTFEIWKRIK